MKAWDKIFKIIILIIGIVLLAFGALLYNFCEQQKAALNSVKDKLDVESEFDSNKFKYESDQIGRLSSDLEIAQQQIKDHNDDLAAQKDALLQEAEKRQQIENNSKAIQRSLVDIMAEADAIKQDMKGWQKDYVSVLAQLEKKMDDSRDEIKNVKDNLDSLNIPELKENIDSLKAAIAKISPPMDNTVPDPPTAPEKKIDRTEVQSQ